MATTVSDGTATIDVECYLNGAGALSGYAQTRSGEQVAFSIIVNDPRNAPGSYSMRGVIDPIARAIVDHAG